MNETNWDYIAEEVARDNELYQFQSELRSLDQKYQEEGLIDEVEYARQVTELRDYYNIAD